MAVSDTVEPRFVISPESSDRVTLEGCFEGAIVLPCHHLTIGATASVRGSIRAQAVTVLGSVSGNVTASDEVLLWGSAVVKGDISSPHIVVAFGAQVCGTLMPRKDARAMDAKPRSVA